MKLVKTNNTTNWKDIDDGDNQKLEDKMIIQLSNMIKKLESFYGFPVDVEWGIENNSIYILQCRPITTLRKK